MNKRKTITDVAKECGLSQATVARVLNGQQDIQVKENAKTRNHAAHWLSPKYAGGKFQASAK